MSIERLQYIVDGDTKETKSLAVEVKGLQTSIDTSLNGQREVLEAVIEKGRISQCTNNSSQARHMQPS